MQELSLLVIDEGQQYGTDREIAVISLLKQQPLVLWTGDRRPCGVVGRASFLTTRTDYRVVVRFPAGPQVSLKVVTSRKAPGTDHKKKGLVDRRL